MDLIALAQPLRRTAGAAYAVAGLVLLVGIGVNILFVDVLRVFPLLVTTTAVAVVAFLGGRWPALLTGSLLWLFSQYYLVAPAFDLKVTSPTFYVSFLFFAASCAANILPMDGMFASNARLQTSEASLKHLNSELDRRVTERTVTLLDAQRQLRATNLNLESLVSARISELKLANEEIQRFAYIVSHDLRAPLVNVLGFTSELDTLRGDLSLLLKEVEREAPHLVTPDRRLAIETELPEALGFIRTSTQKMGRLINAILKLSREGRRKLKLELIDVVDLARTQGQSLSQQLAARDAELLVADDLPKLTSDRLALEQVFGNLIENAVKYLTADRPGRVTVRGRSDADRVCYDIADNGRGIAAKDLERIFELFRRSGEQDTTGEGIGLTYVRNLVRRLGGDVTVLSHHGEGSTFTVELPATCRLEAEVDARENAG